MTAVNVTSKIAVPSHPQMSVLSFGLTHAHLEAAEAVLQTFPGTWEAKLERDYRGETSIILLPEAAAASFAFLLDRSEGQIRLSRIDDDSFTTLGLFTTVQNTLAAIDYELRPSA